MTRRLAAMSFAVQYSVCSTPTASLHSATWSTFECERNRGHTVAGELLKNAYTVGIRYSFEISKTHLDNSRASASPH
jgi:hypothetical protein